MGRSHGRGADQVGLRLPDGLRDKIKEEGALHGRSMNAEIIHRLLAYDQPRPANLQVSEASGPAEAATSPDHDPQHPCKEIGMGTRTDTTAAAPAASDLHWFQLASESERALNTIKIIAEQASHTLIANAEYSVGQEPVCTINGEFMDLALAFVRAVEDIATLAVEKSA